MQKEIYKQIRMIKIKEGRELCVLCPLCFDRFLSLNWQEIGKLTKKLINDNIIQIKDKY